MTPPSGQASPRPWRLVRKDATHFVIVADGASRAVQRWHEAHPGAPINAFGQSIEIARGHVSYNGAGAAYGPRELIDEAEVVANGELILAAVNEREALVRENARLREALTDARVMVEGMRDGNITVGAVRQAARMVAEDIAVALGARAAPEEQT